MKQNKVRLIGIILALALLPWVARWVWLKSYFAKAEQDVSRLAEEIGPGLITSERLDDGLYRNFIAQEPRIGYLVVANFKSNYRSGVTNPQSLHLGSAELERFLREKGTAETLNQLTQPGKGFAGEYLHVITAAFVPPSQNADATPLGMLKVSYVVPGFPSFGRGYTRILSVWSGLCGLLGAIGLVLFHRESRNRATMITANDIASLEMELSNPETFSSENVAGGWRLLFDGQTLNGWKPVGKWYVGDEGELAGQPWGASIVRDTLAIGPNYTYQVQAKKIAGPDGFVILFVCDQRSLAWVLGGWRNTRSEVAGYSSTSVSEKIEKNIWYQLEIRVGSEWIEGFLSGELKWKMARAEVVTSSPEVGFQKGLGVAVWSTLAKFRDLRISSS